MNATIECNGVKVDRVRIPLTTELNAEICRQRAVFRLIHEGLFVPRGPYADGSRFKSNEDVLARIESSVQSLLHFDAFQTEWIQEALRACAEADYWYSYEKRYGKDA